MHRHTCANRHATARMHTHCTHMHYACTCTQSHVRARNRTHARAIACTCTYTCNYAHTTPHYARITPAYAQICTDAYARIRTHLNARARARTCTRHPAQWIHRWAARRAGRSASLAAAAIAAPALPAPHPRAVASRSPRRQPVLWRSPAPLHTPVLTGALAGPACRFWLQGLAVPFADEGSGEDQGSTPRIYPSSPYEAR